MKKTHLIPALVGAFLLAGSLSQGLVQPAPALTAMAATKDSKTNVAVARKRSSKRATRKTNFISEATAKEIAFKHFNISPNAISYIKVELDNDYNPDYEIEFYSGGYEYDINIDAITGAILEHSVEIDD